MSLFGGKDMNSQSASGGGSYFKEGVFLVQLKKSFGKKGFKGETFIAELKVLESDNEKIKVGTTRSFVQKLSPHEYPEMAYGNVADFMRHGLASWMDAAGMDRPKSVDDIDLPDDVADAICSEDNPIQDIVLVLECTTIVTKKGNDFTKHKWAVPTAEVLKEYAA